MTVFALGLGISGMTKQTKVIGFLDLTGAWDPSLAFVMIGAIAVHAPIVWWVQRRNSSIFGLILQFPQRKDIDWKLIVGALVFGIGWGITGICPGPGIVDLVTLGPGIVTFVAAMFVGMALEHFFERRIMAGQKS